MRGQYDEGRPRPARRPPAVGDTADVQFTQPLRYTDAMIALGRGDLARGPGGHRGRAAGDASAVGRAVRLAAASGWACGSRPTRRPGTATGAKTFPAAVHQRAAPSCAALAGQLPTPGPALAGLPGAGRGRARAGRAAGSGDGPAWAAAVAAWRAAEEPYPLSYALLRLAEAHTGAGDRDEAARRGAARRTRWPSGSGAGADRRRGRRPRPPRQAQAGTLAIRRCAGTRHGGPGRTGGPSGRADELARFGLTDREREVLRSSPPAGPTRRSPRPLFISAKTASVHVSNILAKLGVSGRVEAAAVAHRLGMARPPPTSRPLASKDRRGPD